MKTGVLWKPGGALAALPLLTSANSTALEARKTGAPGDGLCTQCHGSALNSEQFASRPAVPGETILLFGAGFGPTSPATPAGQVVTQAAPLANSMQVRFGNVAAEVVFAGLTGAGLYQFNVVVPDVPDGDVSVVAEIEGVRTQDSAFLAIKR